jgi:tRNA A-37 threonylcarbamoyl transferase component Bud32
MESHTKDESGKPPIKPFLKPPKRDPNNILQHCPTQRQDYNSYSSLHRLFPLYKVKANNLLNFLLTPRSKETKPIKVFLLQQRDLSKFKNQTVLTNTSIKENSKRNLERPFSSNGQSNAFSEKQNLTLKKNESASNLKLFHIIKPANAIHKVAVNQNFKNNYRSCFTSGNNIVGDYCVGKSIGQGAYAVVKEGKHRLDGHRVAIKIYEKFRISSKDKKANVENEISILKVLQHPNIPKFIDTIDTQKCVYIIMEYVRGVSLLTFAKSKFHRQFPEGECLKIFSQIISAIQYCHSKGISHRDIKMDNIIIDRQLNVKLIDFGFGTYTKDKVTVFCGTPSYMCPEIVTKVPYYGHMADIWALGILFYTLHVGYYPFRGTNDRELYNKIRKGVYDIPNNLPKSVKNLIKQMLILNPLQRASADAIQNDEYFKESFDKCGTINNSKEKCNALYGKEIVDKLVNC